MNVPKDQIGVLWKKPMLIIDYQPKLVTIKKIKWGISHILYVQIPKTKGYKSMKKKLIKSLNKLIHNVKVLIQNTHVE